MNRIIKKLIPLILSGVMLGIPDFGANAAGWVTVSSWAYNDVSNFTKEGLLPESMEEVTDYTQNITRLQFAELVNSALLAAHAVNQERWPYFDYNFYRDIENNDAAINLFMYSVMEGEAAGEDEEGLERYNFYPDRELTREEMAAVLERALKIVNPSLRREAEENRITPADTDEISEYARDSIAVMLGSGILTGAGENMFLPGRPLTIEQAVAAVYRLYCRAGTRPEADGDSINSDGEVMVRMYSNGLTETKNGNRLYLKNGDDVLIEFETDIYSKILSSTVNETIYAAAQNRYDRTDVYNAVSRELLFTVPYTVLRADNNGMITQSSKKGPMTFGLYGYDGEEILEPKYSQEELSEICLNGFETKKDEYRAADGWVYYSDQSDGGHLYKIDSNGENKQKLSDNDCYDVEYINGWLYYGIRADEGKLYTVREDGKYEQRLTENNAHLIYPDNDAVATNERGYTGTSVMYGFESPFHIGDRVYYIEAVESGSVKENKGRFGNLWSVEMNGGEAKKELVSEIKSNAWSKKTDMIQSMGKRLYFIDLEKDIKNDYTGTDLYCYDGEKVTRINGDMSVSHFAVYQNSLIISTPEDDGYRLYISDPDGGDPKPWNDTEKYNMLLGVSSDYDEIFEAGDDINDEEHTFFWKMKYEKISDTATAGYTTGALYVRDSNGNVYEICGEGKADSGLIRIGDTLYYTQKYSVNDVELHSIYAYDIEKGTQKIIADNVYKMLYKNNDKFIFYQDRNFNIWRYNTENQSIAEIFPNSDSKRYGRLESIYVDNALYKVDSDGNYSLITADPAKYWSYVANGAETGTQRFE